MIPVNIFAVSGLTVFGSLFDRLQGDANIAIDLTQVGNLKIQAIRHRLYAGYIQQGARIATKQLRRNVDDQLIHQACPNERRAQCGARLYQHVGAAKFGGQRF